MYFGLQKLESQNKRGHSFFSHQREKRWIALFTCASTRGVHLEIVNDQSTEEFLMAFARFSGRRGKPLHLYSDNASTFA